MPQLLQAGRYHCHGFIASMSENCTLQPAMSIGAVILLWPLLPDLLIYQGKARNQDSGLTAKGLYLRTERQGTKGGTLNKKGQGKVSCFP